MSSIRSYSRRAGSLFAVAALVLATITPGLIPSFASAAQLNERSIELSSSAATATAVEYTVNFTAIGTAGSMILDFCSNSPLIGAPCTAPTGFAVTSAAATDATSVTDLDANTLAVVDPIAAGAYTLKVTGINNPTASGPLYARIVTYIGTDAATAYQDAETLGSGTLDSGGAAISITDKIAVSGAVLESMTFCVAGPTELVPGSGDYTPTTIGNGCTGTLPAPTLKLGKKTGNVVALDASEVSTGSLYSQISTNAASGATVNLKSSTAGCGGLLRAGSGVGSPTNCDIAPAQATNITAGQAKFGARFSPGTANLIGLGGYNATTYALNYNATDQSTGVTSTYGDPLFSTNSLPVSNENLELIFGASVAPNTPAGLYAAELSLIATGKF